MIIKAKYGIGDSIWFVKDGKPFEDKVKSVSTKTDASGTDISYELEETAAGDWDIESAYPSSRELAIGMGLIARKVVKKKDVSPSVNNNTTTEDAPEAPQDEQTEPADETKE